MVYTPIIISIQRMAVHYHNTDRHTAGIRSVDLINIMAVNVSPIDLFIAFFGVSTGAAIYYSYQSIGSSSYCEFKTFVQIAITELKTTTVTEYLSKTVVNY